MPDLSIDVLLLLALVACAAGFIDAIAGGGGLLTIPALLVAGLNPVQAIATNKLQACFGSFTATHFFIREGLVHPDRQRWSIALTALGAAGGAVAVQWFDSTVLVAVMPYALIIIALYLLLVRKAGEQETSARLSAGQFNASAVPAVGFYDGFFGPGTGTFFTLGYCHLRGMNMLQATAHAKLLNFTTNIVSLIIFIVSGQIAWVVGFSMALGQALGARLGAATAVRRGIIFVRLMTVVVCVAMSISLLLKN